jgi:F-type H+-transporting ATPase subunit b
VSASLTTFLFEAVNFLVLVGLLGWLFFNPVREALEKRKLELQNESNEAAQRLDDVEKVRAELQRRQASLQQDLDDMRQRAKAEAQTDAQQIRTEARSEADRQKQRLRAELATLQDSHFDELSDAVVSSAAEMVRVLLNRISGPELDHALLRVACDQLQSLGLQASETVTVESTRRLTDDECGMLSKTLGRPLETAEVRIAPELAGGIRVTTSQGLIDASLIGLASHAGQIIHQQLDQHYSTPPQITPDVPSRGMSVGVLT